MVDTEQADLTTLTVTLLSAYVSNNMVDSDQLSGLIQQTHSALSGINAPVAPEPSAPVYEPAVSVRKSLASSDHLISMIDGKPYKMLKRHLSTHGLTPAEYRARYKLASDYPMVAKNYSEMRRSVAEKLGLGRAVTKKAPDAAPGIAVPVEVPEAAAVDSAPNTGKARKVAAPRAKAAQVAKPKTAKTSTQKPDAPADQIEATAPKRVRAAAKTVAAPLTEKAAAEKTATPKAGKASKTEMATAPAEATPAAKGAPLAPRKSARKTAKTASA